MEGLLRRSPHELPARLEAGTSKLLRLWKSEHFPPPRAPADADGASPP